jgi:glyoxylase-like metal-dependent hydrolase (beta-lactamase superfamily II)
MDHMGASQAICAELGIPLMCGEADVTAVQSGGRAGLAKRPFAMRLAHRLVAGMGHPVSRTLTEGEQIAGFEVLQTPGHSPGHLAFWRERDRVLILGDVLFNMNLLTRGAGLRLPPAALTPDPALNLQSARRLAALNPDIVCFGHGPPTRDGAAFRRFIEEAEVTHR